MAKGFGKLTSLFVTSEDDGKDSNVDVEAILRQQTAALGGTYKSTVVAEDVVTDVSNITTAEAIYKENGLEDKSKSIFKVEEIKGVLPANLPTEAKKASVVGMMGVSGLTLETVIADAEQRSGILTGALERFTEETIRVVTDSETEISKLEDQINSLRETITSRKKSQEDQEKVINDEVAKINSIVEFIK